MRSAYESRFAHARIARTTGAAVSGRGARTGPPYSSGGHGSDTPTREAFSGIFERYGVDLVLTGHDHHYERMKPQGKVRYLVTGGGGAATYAVDPSDFTAFAEEVVHLVYVEVVGRELTAHAIDGSGQEFDQLYISK